MHVIGRLYAIGAVLGVAALVARTCSPSVARSVDAEEGEQSQGEGQEKFVP